MMQTLHIFFEIILHNLLYCTRVDGYSDKYHSESNVTGAVMTSATSYE